ncbi:MAG TPA: phosphatase PAP2 family protein, partial [Microbacteriaceae bacterium]|nr:phosphatase PAP2 family protein [Microbacteriaceae bacterium]
GGAVPRMNAPDPWRPRRDRAAWGLVSSLSLLVALGISIRELPALAVPLDWSIRAVAAPSRLALAEAAGWVASVTNWPWPELCALLGAVWFGVFRQRWWSAALLAVSAVLVWNWTGVLKHTFARPRPNEPLNLSSYPSGHVLGVTVAAVAFMWVVAKLWVWVVGCAAIAITAADRIIIDAHWFSDVVGGAAAGVALVSAVALGISFCQRLSRRLALS